MKDFHIDLPEEAERPTSLIADHPGDTLSRCADVIAFLANVVANRDDEADGPGPKATQGFFWIARSVEDALRYTHTRIKPIE